MSALRQERFEVRLSATDKSTLERAASLHQKTMSSFVLDSSLSAAQETLAERRHFELSPEQYNAFVAALEAPVKRKSRLEALLARRSVLEK
jgi:uncharacterized protein (DUF1778 family)